MPSNGDSDPSKPQAPSEPAPFDLGAKLAQRLREHVATRDRARRRAEQEAAQLQHLTKSVPRRPRESKAVLQNKAKRLERDRTSRSLPLAQEKALLRQIDAAERSLRLHDEADRHQLSVRRKKAEVDASRAALRVIDATVAEIETALGKVELGKRLGCLPSEVVSRDVACPMDKMSWAIGRDGENLRAIEEGAGVMIEADRLRAKFHLRGSQAAVNEAVARLENFTKAVDEEVKATPDVIAYMLSQHSTVLNKIKDENPDVVIDVMSSKINVRGHPDKAKKAKNDIGEVKIATKTRVLAGRETSLVMGKTSDRAHEISDQHSVVVDMSKKDGDKTTLRIIGPSENVDAALAEVDKLLFENEEIEEFVVVDPMMRTELLNNSGINIHEFQRSLNSVIEAGHPEAGGVFLGFERNGLKEGNPKLLLKCRRFVMDRAKNLVKKKVREFESNVISIDVSEEFISAIIGKGGATINDLRKEGKGALVETDDANKGAIKIYSCEEATRDTIRRKIERIVAENQMGSVPIEKNCIGFLLGDPGKDVRKACADLGCIMGVNDDDTKINIKGTSEKIEQVSELLKEFLSKNFVDELDIAADDQPLLFMGGSDSILHQVDAKYGVHASFRKGKNVLQVRGEADKVSATLGDVKCFLSGGNGMAVCKFNIDDKAKGGVIGKGGGNISKLEEEFKGIRIHVPKDENTISIRGPEDLVEQCRIRLITTIATTRIVETVDISAFQHEKLSKSDVLKQISRITNTQISLNETSVRVRGVNDDVKYAKANVEEHLSGVYHGYIHLEASQFGRVKSAVTKDTSHFQRINASTGADVTLESEAIRISGHKSNVKKAKMSIIVDFLSFMLPRQLQSVKIDRHLLKSMGDPGRLVQIATEAEVSISLDRDINSVLIRSDDPNDCDRGVELVNSLMAECQKLIAVTKFDASDMWLLSVIVGKGGSTIRKLEKDTGCSIDIVRDETSVVMSADSEKAVQVGQKELDNIIYQARKECIFIYLPESAMPAFIGKGGADIKQLSVDNEVQIERPKNRPSTICIKGAENCVANARNAVLSWVQAWEASHIGITIDLEEQLIPCIVGKGGETVRDIEKETGCMIDVNRQQSSVTVKYGNDANRDSAIEKIQAIIDEELAKSAGLDETEAKFEEEPEQAAAEKAKLIEEQTQNTTAEAGCTAAGDEEFAAHSEDQEQSAEKEENGINPAIHGTKEGRQLYQWLLTGHVGDAINGIVYSDNDSESPKNGDNGSFDDEDPIIIKKDDTGEEVRYYQSESGFSVRLPSE